MTCSNSSSIWILSTLLEFSFALLAGHVLQCALIPHAVPHVDERHFNSIRIREGSEISQNLLQYHVSLTVRISEGRREEYLELPRKSFREAVLQNRCEVASKSLIQLRNGLSIHLLSFYPFANPSRQGLEMYANIGAPSDEHRGAERGGLCYLNPRMFGPAKARDSTRSSPISIRFASVQYNRYHVVIYERSMVRRGKWKKGTVATDRRIVLWLVY